MYRLFKPRACLGLSAWLIALLLTGALVTHALAEPADVHEYLEWYLRELVLREAGMETPEEERPEIPRPRLERVWSDMSGQSPDNSDVELVTGLVREGRVDELREFFKRRPAALTEAYHLNGYSAHGRSYNGHVNLPFLVFIRLGAGAFSSSGVQSAFRVFFEQGFPLLPFIEEPEQNLDDPGQQFYSGRTTSFIGNQHFVLGVQSWLMKLIADIDDETCQKMFLGESGLLTQFDQFNIKNYHSSYPEKLQREREKILGWLIELDNAGKAGACLPRLLSEYYQQSPAVFNRYVVKEARQMLYHTLYALAREQPVLFTQDDGNNLVHSLVNSMGPAENVDYYVNSLRKLFESILVRESLLHKNALAADPRELSLAKALNTVNSRGETPVFLALKQGKVEIAELLLAYGGELSPAGVDSFGKTVMDYAQLENNWGLIRWLLRNGVPPGTLDNETKVILLLTAEYDQRIHLEQQFKLSVTGLLAQSSTEQIVSMARRHPVGIATAVMENLSQFQGSIVPLSRVLLDGRLPSLAFDLLEGNPCRYYQAFSDQYPVMAGVCAAAHSDGVLKLLSGHRAWKAVDQDPFGFSPLHLAAILSDAPGGRSVFLALASEHGHFERDKMGKAAGHYLLGKSDSAQLLFHLFINRTSIKEGDSRLPPVYYTLAAEALERKDQKSLAVIQLFRGSLYPSENAYGPANPKPGGAIINKALELGVFSWVRQDLVREGKGEGLGSYFSWLPWSGGDITSPLEQFLIDVRGNYYPARKWASVAQRSRILTKTYDPREMDLWETLDNLFAGANPNEWISDYGQHTDIFSFPNLLIRYPSDDDEKRFGLLASALVFGTDIVSAVTVCESYKKCRFAPVAESLRKDLLNNTAERDLSDDSVLMIRQQQKIIKQAGLEGEISRRHPVCTCLGLKTANPEQQNRLRPWCQVKAREADIIDELIGICEKYQAESG